MAHFYFDARKLRHLVERKGMAATIQHLRENLESKAITAADFSVRNLYEGLIPGGTELLGMLDGRRKSAGSHSTLYEAAQAVDTSAFSNITGQIIYNKILEGYTNPALLWPDLITPMQTVFLENERLAGIGETGDLFEVVDEGQPYPTIGLNEEYVDLPPLAKRGAIIPITREIIVADRTGELMKKAADSGKYMGINKEKRVMSLVTGQQNSYKRNNVSSNTFQQAGSYINQTAPGANQLVSWRSLENQELLFDLIQDPNTGEPIIVSGDMTMLVPSALKMTALRIINVETIGQVDNTSSASTVRQYGPNPMRAGLVNGGNVAVKSNAYVRLATGSTTQWFYGQPKKAFVYRYAWDIETEEASGNLSEAQFVNDIWMRHKFSEMAREGVENPRFWSMGQ